jgi:hypothetical protein
MSEWKPVAEPPPLHWELCSWWESDAVLVYTKSGSMRIARIEQYDADDPANWYSDCSEHLNLTYYVLFWMPLPDPPSRS